MFRAGQARPACRFPGRPRPGAPQRRRGALGSSLRLALWVKPPVCAPASRSENHQPLCRPAKELPDAGGDEAVQFLGTVEQEREGLAQGLTGGDGRGEVDSLRAAGEPEMKGVTELYAI